MVRKRPIGMLKTVQVARQLGISQKEVLRLIKYGYLKSERLIESKGSWHFISKETLAEFKKNHPVLPILPTQKSYYKPITTEGKQFRETAAWKEQCFARAQEVAANRGGECLSESYEHSHKPMRWRCAEGHEWSRVWYKTVKAGSWCSECAKSEYFIFMKIRSTTKKPPLLHPH